MDIDLIRYNPLKECLKMDLVPKLMRALLPA